MPPIPTLQQKKIIEHDGNLVIIAKPGSGKTFVLSQKIQNILPTLKKYKGVIAISFTNKASKELEERSLPLGVDRKQSFFGTIDKFSISEIIIPFGKHIFGEFDIEEYKTIKLDDIETRTLSKDLKFDELQSDQIEEITTFLNQGIIPMDLDSVIALYIIKNSVAAQNYMKARYSHIIIDEYQDSRLAQHQLFKYLVALGMTGIAVGDINQSIYAFAGGNAEYLFSLTTEHSFQTFNLDLNHRSHKSIIYYSNTLISAKSDVSEDPEKRVFGKKIIGNYLEIANWLDEAIPKYINEYSVHNFCDIAILTRGAKNGASLIDENLKLPHKFVYSTDLDQDLGLWSVVFSRILSYCFDKKDTNIEVVEKFLNLELLKSKTKNVLHLVKNLKCNFATSWDIDYQIQLFIQIANLIYPKAESTRSIDLLQKVLSSQELLNQYKPAQDNEVQIMTMHKSKGLEFDIVFHLDLYDFIFPAKRKNDVGQWINVDFTQDLNLHYVSITRAKKACILCFSTKRINRFGEEISAKYSEFFTYNSVNKLSEASKY